MNITRGDEPGHFTKPSQNGSCMGSCLFYGLSERNVIRGDSRVHKKSERRGWFYSSFLDYINVLMLTFRDIFARDENDRSMTFFHRTYTRTIYLIFLRWIFLLDENDGCDIFEVSVPGERKQLTWHFRGKYFRTTKVMRFAFTWRTKR